MTVDELTLKEEWQSVRQGGDENFPVPLDGKKEDASNHSAEMIDESQESHTKEQRENLYHKINRMSAPEKFRLAIFANREVRSLLINDPKKMIALAVLKNQKMNQSEVLQYVQRRDLSVEVLSAIAKDHKWQRYYPIKFALVSNPKTPIPVAISLFPYLHESDLKSISLDKNAPPVLRQRAHEILVAKKRK